MRRTSPEVVLLAALCFANGVLWGDLMDWRRGVGGGEARREGGVAAPASSLSISGAGAGDGVSGENGGSNGRGRSASGNTTAPRGPGDNALHRAARHDDAQDDARRDAPDRGAQRDSAQSHSSHEDSADHESAQHDGPHTGSAETNGAPLADDQRNDGHARRSEADIGSQEAAGAAASVDAEDHKQRSGAAAPDASERPLGGEVQPDAVAIGACVAGRAYRGSSIVARLSVSAAGRVTAVELVGADFLPANDRVCVERVLRSWRPGLSAAGTVALTLVL